MSDDLLLTDVPVTFRDWSFASCDLECELRFQTLHTSWARNQIEAAATGVSPASHVADLDRHVEHVEGNRFAFGGPLSLRFLLSDHGMLEYLTLLAAKAGRRAASKQALDGLRRKDRKAFDDLVGTVLRRDFPNLMPAEDSSSLPPATLSPSITGSASCSRASPGERVASRSSV